MKTKFNINQKVWFMAAVNPTNEKITRITVDKDKIIYTIAGKWSIIEEKIGATKEELKEIVFNK